MGCDCRDCRETQAARATGTLLSWYVRFILGFVRSLYESFCSPTKRQAIFSLILLFTSLGLISGVVPKSWLYNSPTMFLLAGLLAFLLRGPLNGLATPFYKAVAIGISLCLLASVAMVLDWRPLWILMEPFGLTRNQTGFHLLLVCVVVWWAAVLWIVFSPSRVLRSRVLRTNR